MRRLLALLALCLCAAVQAREVIPLNAGWKFRYGHAFEKDNWKAVTLPHTWNTADAESAHPYTRTLGIYKMNLKTRPEWKGKRVFLRLKGAGVIADVQFNNVWLGQHRGAYTAFCYELTPHLPPAGKSAELRIRVSNAETSDIIPLTGDFNIFGGLYRGVELIVADPVCVSPLDNGSSGHRRRARPRHHRQPPPLERRRRSLPLHPHRPRGRRQCHRDLRRARDPRRPQPRPLPQRQAPAAPRRLPPPRVGRQALRPHRGRPPARR